MENQRATNLELQKWIARRHGFVVESIWLEYYRQQLGRGVLRDTEQREEPDVPPEKQVAIRQAFRHFGMIP